MKRSMQKQFKSHRISLAAMFTAFSLLFLFLSSILPFGRVTMYFLSSIFISGILLEDDFSLALLSFIATSLLSLLILPDIIRVVPFVLFFGHYGIGKKYIEKIKDKVISFILKLLYFNICMALIYFAASSVWSQDLSLDLPLWLIIAIMEIVFVLYDIAYSKIQEFYWIRIRRWLTR